MPTIDEEVKVASTLASTKASPADLETDDGVQFGDEDAMARTGLQKITPPDENGGIVRCAPLPDVTAVRAKWLHFINVGGKKYPYRCLSVRDKKGNIITKGICCAKLGNDKEQRAQKNFAALALKYKNAPIDGKYKAIKVIDADGTERKTVPPITWEIAWLKLSQAGFIAISEMMWESETQPLFDIGIKSKSNKIGFDYIRLSEGISLFRKSDDFLAEVLAEAKKFADGEFLLSQLGKVVTEIEMKAILSGTVAGASTAPGGTSQIDNTDDL